MPSFYVEMNEVNLDRWTYEDVKEGGPVVVMDDLIF